jgi:FkbM family methyltransferase
VTSRYSALRHRLSYHYPPSLWSRLHPDPINDALRRLGRGISFVQIGSNDGLTMDPLHRFVNWAGWRGVAIEPLPTVFARLQRNYRLSPRVRCLNLAVGAEDGELPFYYVTQARPGDPAWVDQFGSFDRGHLDKHADWMAGLEDRIGTTTVPTVTLASLHARLGHGRFDLLHVDAEGFDEVILSQLDPDAWGLRAVLFEDAHMDPARVEARLRAAGFVQQARFEGDVLYAR